MTSQQPIRGRVGRVDFAVMYAAAFGGWVLGLLLLGLVLDERTAATVATLAFAPVAWILVGNTIRRLHDLNKPAALLVLGFLPIINLGLAMYLILTPGDVGFNRHGQPPSRAVLARVPRTRVQVNASGP